MVLLEQDDYWGVHTILDTVCRHCESQHSCSLVCGRSESFLPPSEGLRGLNESKKEKEVQINPLPTGHAGRLCLCLAGEFFRSGSSPVSRRRGDALASLDARAVGDPFCASGQPLGTATSPESPQVPAIHFSPKLKSPDLGSGGHYK